MSQAIGPYLGDPTRLWWPGLAYRTYCSYRAKAPC